MQPRICRCCGEVILARSGNPNICMDCERLVEDDSPVRAAEVASASLEEVSCRYFPDLALPEMETVGHNDDHSGLELMSTSVQRT